MVEVEGCFVKASGSPILKTIVTVSNTLKAIEER
jgi:hypothetical protein